MKLIIQIPCYNETETLRAVVSEFPTSIVGIDVIESLVIDDGSVDGTSELATRLGVTHLIRHTRNRGLAASYATGISTALKLGADIIVNTDGDNQYPGRYIAALDAPIIEGHADLVVGDRNASADMRTTRLKRSLQKLGSRVISLLAGTPLPDPVSGFRAISRDAAFRINLVSRYSYTIESLLQAANKKLAIVFVPIHTNAATRPSRLFQGIPNFVMQSASTMMRIFFMYHALQVLLALSLIVAVVGMIPICRFLIFWMMGMSGGHIQSLVLGAALLILASLMLLGGLLGDLIASNRIMIEEILERIERMETNNQSGEKRDLK